MSIAMEMGMAGEIKEQQENPILAIFCGIFFLGINPPVEKSWQETGGLYSRKRRKIIFQDFVSTGNGKIGSELWNPGIFGDGVQTFPALIWVPKGQSTGISIPAKMGISFLEWERHPK